MTKNTAKKLKPAKNNAPDAATRLLQQVQAQLKSMEDHFSDLQTELQETLSQMEARIDNLELVLAELQAELMQKESSRSTTARVPFH